jgi:hypothetical protein
VEPTKKCMLLQDVVAAVVVVGGGGRQEEVERAAGPVHMGGRRGGEFNRSGQHLQKPVLRIRNPVLFYPPDPGSGLEQWSEPVSANKIC